MSVGLKDEIDQLVHVFYCHIIAAFWRGLGRGGGAHINTYYSGRVMVGVVVGGDLLI